MKKYVIIALIALVGLAIFIGPLLSDNGSKETDGDEAVAEFAFEENLAARWNQVTPIEINVKEGIKKLELFYNDSLFQVWDNPKNKVKYNFNAGFFGLGTRTLVLMATMEDGTQYTDNRMVRVLSDVKPEIWIAKAVGTKPHLSNSFTQGLEFNDGILYEGTGQFGQSLVATVDLETGQHKKKMGLDGNYFGEGITIFGDQLYQITWQQQKCFVYNKTTLELIKDMSYVGEGWGLCNNGEELIMSDGTERLSFRDAETFQITRTIEVYDDRGPITKLNELEYIDGLIYANVWMTNSVVVIQPENGKVVAVIDGTELIRLGRNGGDVMNGIALNDKTGKLYMTGKNWSKLIEVELKKP
jgi:glutamine cyclotransferase